MNSTSRALQFTRFHVYLRTLGTLACLVFALSLQVPAAVAAGQLSVGSNRVGDIEISRRHYGIWPDTQNYLPENSKRPESWFFYVEPIVEATFTAAGALKYATHLMEKTTVSVQGVTKERLMTRVAIPLLIHTDEQMQRAVDDLNSRGLADKSYVFKKNQVLSLPLVSVGVELPDLRESGCSLVNSRLPLEGAGVPEVSILVDCVDHRAPASRATTEVEPPPNVARLLRNLPVFNAKKMLEFEGKAVQIAVVEVRDEDWRSAVADAKVAGDGNEFYVTRNDARSFAVTVTRNTRLSARGRQLSSSEASACMLDKLMSFREETIEAKTYIEEVLKRTYNAKDLEPNYVAKTMDDRIDKSSDESNVKINGSANASFLGFSGGASASGETFRKTASEHGVKVAFEGGKWIAKGLNLIHANVAQLAQSASRSCAFSTFGESQAWATSNQVLQFKARL